ncbi:intradiol ring-cleavage dioxygenase [Kineococcus sp. LSe6-4]|uniref:Intradiol ring-cleavage dioxygenase n=1 Tax=Kineococcus halophytocola TaxID=3234027 RepID=A0ABV4GVF0_9ACTN
MNPLQCNDAESFVDPAPDPALDNQVDNAAYVRAVHDNGLAFDLATLSRRRMLTGLGSAGAAAAVAGIVGAQPAAAAVPEIESETAGPYPGDGSNGVEIRTADGIVRNDIRSTFGTTNNLTATGIPLTINLTITDLDENPLPGHAVYLWHCDRDGNYSLYSTGITDQNYLRGIATTSAAGLVSFTSIFPACYSGRWPHIHFQVYSTIAEATSGSGTIRKTSQLAIPEDAADAVYATTGYSRSITNMAQVSLETDNVFGDDDAATELATVTGDVTAGYTVALTAPIDPAGREATGGGGVPGGPGGSGGPGQGPGTGAPTAPPTAPSVNAPAAVRRSRTRR